MAGRQHPLPDEDQRLRNKRGIAGGHRGRWRKNGSQRQPVSAYKQSRQHRQRRLHSHQLFRRRYHTERPGRRDKGVAEIRLVHGHDGTMLLGWFYPTYHQCITGLLHECGHSRRCQYQLGRRAAVRSFRARLDHRNGVGQPGRLFYQPKR